MLMMSEYILFIFCKVDKNDHLWNSTNVGNQVPYQFCKKDAFHDSKFKS